MEENLEEPLDRGDLAKAAGLSSRQLERLFRKYLNRSPARYYVELRLNRARLLLLQTNMPVIDVALACGFVSASPFLQMLPRLSSARRRGRNAPFRRARRCPSAWSSTASQPITAACARLISPRDRREARGRGANIC